MTNPSNIGAVARTSKRHQRSLSVGTALLTGVVWAAALSSSPAYAACGPPAGTTFNCVGPAEPNNYTFNTGGNYTVNIGTSGNETNLTGVTGVDSAAIKVEAKNNDGTITSETGTRVSGGSKKKKPSSVRHGIEIDKGHKTDVFVHGTITATNGAAIYLNPKNNKSELTVNVEPGGILGGESEFESFRTFLEVDNVYGKAKHTTVFNNGTINGNVKMAPNAKGLSIYNYSPTTWNTSGTSLFTDDDDLVDNDGGVLNTNLLWATFEFLKGKDTIRNQNGGEINLNSLANTFNMGKGPDMLDNTGAGTMFNANGLFNGFFFGDGTDTMYNREGAVFNANGALNIFSFGDKGDDFYNDTGAQFNTQNGEVTLFDFGNGWNNFYNQNSAIFNTGGIITSFEFGDGRDSFFNDSSAIFNTNVIGDLTRFDFGLGQDNFYNQNSAVFNTGGAETTFDFGNGWNNFYNQNSAVFNTGSDLTKFEFGDGNDEFFNQSSAVFNTNVNGGGLTWFDFGKGQDKFYNQSGAVLQTNGFTVLDFGDGNDLLMNTSTIRVNDSLRTYNLELFDNAGGLLDMRDGAVDDETVLFFINNDANFGGGGMLGIDSELTPGGAADFLRVGGNTTGPTEVLVNDIDGNPGAVDPIGVVFAQVDGTTSTGDFYLDGPISKGFVNYDVYLRPAGDPNNVTASDEWILASTVGENALALANVGGGAGSFWHQGAGTWLQRMTDLRNYLQSEGDSYGGDGTSSTNGYGLGASSVGGSLQPGFWFRAYGAKEERNISNQVAAPVAGTITVRDSYDQKSFGGVFGADAAAGENWVVGLSAGLGDSSMRFKSGVNIDFEAATVGGYATYVNNGMFFDAMLKADFGTATYTVGTSAKTNYTALGGVVDAGYRFDHDMMYFEPGATLAYVNTDVDNAVIFGSAVNFSDGESLRGRLGGRVGFTADHNDIRFDQFVEASAWRETKGNYSSSFALSGITTPVAFDAGGDYGEVAIGLNATDLDGVWSAYGRGNYMFGEDGFKGVSFQAGMRKYW